MKRCDMSLAWKLTPYVFGVARNKSIKLVFDKVLWELK